MGTTVYGVLRTIAQRHMAGERPGHTLSATALVNEAYLKLQGGAQPFAPADRGAFYRAAGEAMRRILIDHARHKKAIKRGGGQVMPFSSLDELAQEASGDEVVSLDDAFVRLEGEDERAADVVRLRFYAGLTVDQTADVLGISRRSVLRDWEYARAYLMTSVQRASRDCAAGETP